MNMKIKRIFMIFVTMMFCFLFSQYIVYAKPDPSINVNAKFNNKQNIEKVEIAFYINLVNEYYNDRFCEYFGVLTLLTQSDICYEECHTPEYINTNIKSGEKVKCKNGCIIKKLDSDALSNRGDFTYQGRNYTHYTEYTLLKDDFSQESSKLNFYINIFRHSLIDTSPEKYSVYDSRVFRLNYSIENNYIYIEENESDEIKGTSCILNYFTKVNNYIRRKIIFLEYSRIS